MCLKDWLRNGWLTEHETSPEEIAEQEAKEMIHWLSGSGKELMQWLKLKHPELVPEDVGK